MGETPGALQLCLLQTVADVASEKNSTLVMPFPVELLRFFENRSGDPAPTTTAAAPAPVPASEPDAPAALETTATTDAPTNGAAVPSPGTDLPDQGDR
jgi:hypothetical protein